MSRGLLVVLIYVISLRHTAAEYEEGDVNLEKDKGVSFLGHWMFRDQTGNETCDWECQKAGVLQITLKLKNPIVDKNHDKFELALYNDQPDSWQIIMKNKSKVCNDFYGVNQTMTREHAVIEFLKSGNNDTWTATINIHEHIIPRWWWVYLVKCDWPISPAGDVDGDIHYALHWRQSNTIQWRKEVSVNEELQNTFTSVIPWSTFSLFIIQCIAYYLHWREPVKGYVHIIIKLFTLLLFLQFIARIFEMSYWLHLTFSGYKEFSLMAISYLFEAIANIFFLYLFFTIFVFGWRMNIDHLNKKLNYILIVICIIIEIFDYCIFIWGYRRYNSNNEMILYRYSDEPQDIYGKVMLIFGIIWYLLSLIYSFHNFSTGLINKEQTIFRSLIGFCLLFTWFLWPIIAVAAFKTIHNYRADFVCDVVSWCMKMCSFLIFLFITFPINPCCDKYFDFGSDVIPSSLATQIAGINGAISKPIEIEEDEFDDYDGIPDNIQNEEDQTK